jgi:hypothetical protein
MTGAQEAHRWQARKAAGYRPKTNSIDAVALKAVGFARE